MIRKVFVIVVVLIGVSSPAGIRADDDEAEANLWTLGPEAYLVSQPAPNLATGEAVPRATRSSARFRRIPRADPLLKLVVGQEAAVGKVQALVLKIPAGIILPVRCAKGEKWRVRRSDGKSDLCHVLTPA